MNIETVDALLAEARVAAGDRDATAVVQRIDDAIAACPDGTELLGYLHMTRAIAQQCAPDLRAPAHDAEIALRLLRSSDEKDKAAYAASAAAVFFHRIGNVERAIENAVDAMVLLGAADPASTHSLSARNSLAQIFQHLSSHLLAVELATKTFNGSEHVPRGVRSHYAFNVGQTMIEATLHHPDPDPAWLEIALSAIDYLGESDAPTTTMFTAMLRGEIFLIRDEPDSYAALVEHLNPLDATDHDCYSIAGERLVPWHQLVRATGALRWGDPEVAIELLTIALPRMKSLGDELRYTRGLRVLSDARLASGDAEGAAAAAITLSEHLHSTRTHQVGRLAALMTRRAELELDRTELIDQADQLEQEASVDSVTGLMSRRWLELRLDELSESELTVGVVVIDLDKFKSINDTYGHPLGDKVLATVGKLIRQATGSTDCARYGGEEFVLLRTDATLAEIQQLAEDTLMMLRTHSWDTVQPGMTLTASAGVSVGPSSQVRNLVRRADSAMYEAKTAGRDQVRDAT